jgi:hypothetical protein
MPGGPCHGALFGRAEGTASTPDRGFSRRGLTSLTGESAPPSPFHVAPSAPCLPSSDAAASCDQGEYLPGPPSDLVHGLAELAPQSEPWTALEKRVHLFPFFQRHWTLLDPAQTSSTPPSRGFPAKNASARLNRSITFRPFPSALRPGGDWHRATGRERIPESDQQKSGGAARRRTSGRYLKQVIWRPSPPPSMRTGGKRRRAARPPLLKKGTVPP